MLKFFNDEVSQEEVHNFVGYLLVLVDAFLEHFLKNLVPVMYFVKFDDDFKFTSPMEGYQFFIVSYWESQKFTTKISDSLPQGKETFSRRKIETI